jgi:hypothetical protein
MRRWRQDEAHALVGSGGAASLAGPGNSINTLTDLNNTDGTPREAFNLVAGATSTNVFSQVDSPAVCLNLTSTNGNMVGGAFKTGDIRLRQRFLTTFRLPGYGGGQADTAAVVAFVQNNNTGVETGSAIANFPAGGSGFVGGAACAQP